MKKCIAWIVLVVLCVGCLSACSAKSTKEEVAKLSDSCNKVLASGTDAEGNIFELVANQTEEYDGTTIELGIIKNNEWSVPLSTQAPFLREDGFFLTDEEQYANYDLESEDKYRIFYAGSGCFYYEFPYFEFNEYNEVINLFYLTALWNGNNGKSYVDREKRDDLVCVEGMHNDSPYVLIDHGTFTYGPNHVPQTDVPVLDMQTMEIVKTFSVEGTGVHPYVDGLFGVQETTLPSTLSFYDIDGKRLFSLKEYGSIVYSSSTTVGGYWTEQETEKYYFKDGQFTFETKNANGVAFDITVDKTGKLVKSEQK